MGISRTFSSFNELAGEDAYPRIPLDVHFGIDLEKGVCLSKLAAQ